MYFNNVLPQGEAFTAIWDICFAFYFINIDLVPKTLWQSGIKL